MKSLSNRCCKESPQSPSQLKKLWARIHSVPSDASFRQHPEARHCRGEQAAARERPQAGSCRPAMLDVISLGEELRHSIGMGNQIHACLALQWGVTTHETPLKSISKEDTSIDDKSGEPIMDQEPIQAFGS